MIIWKLMSLIRGKILVGTFHLMPPHDFFEWLISKEELLVYSKLIPSVF